MVVEWLHKKLVFALGLGLDQGLWAWVLAPTWGDLVSLLVLGWACFAVELLMSRCRYHTTSPEHGNKHLYLIS